MQQYTTLQQCLVYQAGYLPEGHGQGALAAIANGCLRLLTEVKLCALMIGERCVCRCAGTQCSNSMVYEVHSSTADIELLSYNTDRTTELPARSMILCVVPRKPAQAALAKADLAPRKIAQASLAPRTASQAT